jgi:hypothetical protein
MVLDHTVTPSARNELGIKGVGEEDALELPSKGVDILEIPLSPNRLWEMVNDSTKDD